jgi:hypothetical protein
MEQSRIANRIAALIILVASTLGTTAPAVHSGDRTTARVSAGTCCW